MCVSFGVITSLRGGDYKENNAIIAPQLMDRVRSLIWRDIIVPPDRSTAIKNIIIHNMEKKRKRIMS